MAEGFSRVLKRNRVLTGKKKGNHVTGNDHESSKDNISTMGELDSWGQGRVLESWEIGFLFGCPRNLGINILQSIILHKSFQKILNHTKC